jgi:predicted small metal-binding protein
MAKEMRCADLGMDCGYVARGETEDEVMQQAAQHGKQAHGMTDEDLQGMESDIRGAVHEAA